MFVVFVLLDVRIRRASVPNKGLAAPLAYLVAKGNVNVSFIVGSANRVNR
jgi:hypothetical protein